MRPVGGEGGAQADDRVLARGAGEEVLAAVVDDLDGTPQLACCEGGIGLEAGVELRAEAAADVVADHPDVGRPNAEELRDAVADVERVLACRVDDVAAVLVPR